MSLWLIKIHGEIGVQWSFILQVSGKLTALKGLDARLREIRSYLDLVVDEKLPLNHEILYHLQVHFLIHSLCMCMSSNCFFMHTPYLVFTLISLYQKHYEKYFYML